MIEQSKQLDEDGLVIRTNKEAEKRSRQALKDFAKMLLKLPGNSYRNLPIDESLRAALLEGKRLSNNAYQRQLVFLTRLLANADTDKIMAAYQRISHPYRYDSVKIKTIENYRDQLLSADKDKVNTTIASLLNAFQSVEVQYLRQLVRNAHKEMAKTSQQQHANYCDDRRAKNRNEHLNIEQMKSAKLLYRYLFRLELK